MATTKEGRASDLRGKSEEELRIQLDHCGQELMNLRFQNAVARLEKPTRLSELKKKRARILTIMRERRGK